MDALPGILLRMNLWDIVGVTAYVLAFTLFESLAFFLPILLVAFLVPPRFSRPHFVALGSLAAFVTSYWAMFVNIRGFYYGAVTESQFVAGAGLYLLTLLLPSLLILRFRRIEALMRSIMETLSVLAYVYLPFAVISLLIVLIRNI